MQSTILKKSERRSLVQGDGIVLGTSSVASIHPCIDKFHEEVSKCEGQQDTSISRDIRVICEIEKMWIIHNLMQDQKLGMDELGICMKDSVFQDSFFKERQLALLNQIIQSDNSMIISKKELIEFFILIAGYEEQGDIISASTTKSSLAK